MVRHGIETGTMHKFSRHLTHGLSSDKATKSMRRDVSWPSPPQDCKTSRGTSSHRRSDVQTHIDLPTLEDTIYTVRQRRLRAHTAALQGLRCPLMSFAACAHHSSTSCFGAPLVQDRSPTLHPLSMSTLCKFFYHLCAAFRVPHSANLGRVLTFSQPK